MTFSEKCLQAIEDGDMAEAQKEFAWALRKDDDEILFNLAEQLQALGLVSQARRAYLKLLERYPDEDELRTSLAEIAIDNGHNDEALAYLAQISPSSPAYVQSLLVAADLYQTEGQFEVTEEKLQAAYQAAPEEPAVLFAMGEFYYLVGQFDKAIPYYFALIKTGATEFAKVDIAGRLGMCYAQSGRYEQALGYLKQVAPEYQSSDVRFQTGLTQLELDDTKAAIDTLTALIKEDNQYASAYPVLARAYEKTNQYADALKTVQEGLGVDQYNEQLYSLAARMASHVNDSDLMKKYLQKAHELDPDNLTITLEYSNLLLKLNDHQSNVDLLQPLIKEDEIDPQIYWNLAVSYQALEKFDLAGKYYQAALPTYSEQLDFLKNLIGYYQETGQREAMIDEMEHYVRLNPADTEMQERLDQEMYY